MAQLQNDNAALSELVTSLESDLINATTCQLVPFKSNTSSVSEAPVGDGGGGPADPATNGTFDPLNPVIEQFEIPFEYGNCARANLSGADLSGMDLTGIVLRSANLEGANLSAARLNESLLMNIEGNSFTNFSNAYLRYADLTDAYLVSADLTGADLRYADLKFADFTSATVTNTNFDDTYWHQTIWTDGDRYDSNQA